MADDILPIISVVVIVAGIIVGWIWQTILRKDRRRIDMQVSSADIDRTAREKSAAERGLAREIVENNEKLALDVKQSMKDHISGLIFTLKQDIELQRVLVYAKIDVLDLKVQQDKIDLAEHIRNEKDDRERIKRSIEFLQTMAWGPEAKSIPPYMLGEKETELHKDEPGVGVFKQTPEEAEDAKKKKPMTD